MYGDNTGWDLKPLVLEYTENGQYSVIPPSGYDGFSSVNVTVDVDCSECNLTTSTVTLTGDGEHTITPPEGYDGFSEVVVNVESDCDDAYNEGVADQKAKLASATFTENGSYNREDGWNTVTVNVDTVTPYNEGVEDGKDAQKALMTSLTAVSNGTYTREDGYNEVVVNVPSDVRNQNKQVEFIQNGTQTVLADSGYSGLGQVEVSVNVDTTTPYNEGKQDGIDEQKSKLTELQVTQNGEYEREDGYNRVVVDVDLNVPYNEGREDGIEEQKSKMTSGTFTENGTYNREDGYNQVVVDVDTVTPYNNGKQDGIDEQKAKLTDITIVSNGHYEREDGYNDITVNVPSDVNNQNKTVNPSTSNQVITADQGYSGLGQVTVNAVTASIDPDIRPENIKKDVEILGITGTYDPQPDLESRTATYTTNGTYSINPTTGKDGLSGVQITVNVDTQTPYDNGYADGEADQKAKLSSLTVTQNGTYTRADGYDEVVVNVQCGGTDELQLSKEIIEVESDGDFPADGITYPIGVYSTDDWTITSKPDWVSTDSDSGNAGVSLLNVTVNSLEDGRTGTITITNGTITKTITINQTDYSARYLTLEVTSPGTLYWKQYGTQYSRTIQYSFSGTNWSSRTSITTNNGCKVASLSTGSKLLLKAPTPDHSHSSVNYWYFVFADGLKCNVSGNINSFKEPYGIFRNCTGIQSAEHLIVPEGTNCSSLFVGCTGLTTAPKSLPRGRYQGMFSGCTNLVNAPELPSTTLDASCYSSMFYGCTKLVNAPKLPATTLAQNCYDNMFGNCDSLTTAPELPALTLVSGCYNSMFYGCNNLNYVKAMFTTTPGSNYTSTWLYGVSATGTFVKNSAATWTDTGTSAVPTGWTVETATS